VLPRVPQGRLAPAGRGGLGGLPGCALHASPPPALPPLGLLPAFPALAVSLVQAGARGGCFPEDPPSRSRLRAPACWRPAASPAPATPPCPSPSASPPASSRQSGKRAGRRAQGSCGSRCRGCRRRPGVPGSASALKRSPSPLPPPTLQLMEARPDPRHIPRGAPCSRLAVLTVGCSQGVGGCLPARQATANASPDTGG
jgi:hypothetical protein